jgi:2-keto-4-pentenoate hydratase
MAYLLIIEVALTGNPTTPWVWAARPTHDHGAALCAGVVFAAGIVAVTVLGARDGGGRSSPRN